MGWAWEGEVASKMALLEDAFMVLPGVSGGVVVRQAAARSRPSGARDEQLVAVKPNESKTTGGGGKDRRWPNRDRGGTTKPLRLARLRGLCGFGRSSHMCGGRRVFPCPTCGAVGVGCCGHPCSVRGFDLLPREQVVAATNGTTGGGRKDTTTAVDV